jgi:hypothetical protein
MNPEEFKGTTRERLFAFNLQEWFDKRYVPADGVYKLIVALVIGFAGLILTGVVVAALAYIIK